MVTAEPAASLDIATAKIADAGPPGVHLSVATSAFRAHSCRGLAQAFGDENTPLRRPLTPETAHDLGSVTKIAGTTTMLAALVSADHLQLGARIRHFLPSFAADVSLIDLLRHRSGLWEWWPTYLQVEPARHDPAAVLSLVGSLPLRYRPRSGRHYSDLGFMALGRVVEIVAAAPLRDAFAELVSGPIGRPGLRYGRPAPGIAAAASSSGDQIEQRMVSTGVPYPVPVDGTGFNGWRQRILVGEVNDGNAFHSFGGAAGHAGLFATVDDLHVLGRALLEGAAGKGPWHALPQFLEPGPDPGQLLGFRTWGSQVDGCTAQAIGHTGFPGIGFAVLPEHDATVVLATNRLHVRRNPAIFEPLWHVGIDAAHASIHAAR